MMSTYAVIVCAGKGRRFSEVSNHSTLKQYIEIGSTPLWVRATRPFEFSSRVDGIVLVIPANDILEIQSQLSKYSLNKVLAVVEGGEKRQDSVLNGLSWIKQNIKNFEYVFVHDGVRPFINVELIHTLWKNKEGGAVIPVVPISDTVKMVENNEVKQTIDRTLLKRAQTPQLFKFDLLWSAFQWLKDHPHSVTDESNILELMGVSVKTIEGQVTNIKITVPDDLRYQSESQTSHLSFGESSIHVGQGIDVHAFGEGSKIILGGIEIPHEKSLIGHSDADVLTHAICDGLLGAAGMNDIGHYFPNTDDRYKNISSLILLEKVIDKVQRASYKISHIDVTVLAEKPKLASFIPEIKIRLASKMKLEQYQLAVKATTTEKLGFIGRSEGIAAQAIVTLIRKPFL